MWPTLSPELLLLLLLLLQAYLPRRRDRFLHKHQLRRRAVVGRLRRNGGGWRQISAIDAVIRHNRCAEDDTGGFVGLLLESPSVSRPRLRLQRKATSF